jgi:hypothetical protein
MAQQLSNQEYYEHYQRKIVEYKKLVADTRIAITDAKNKEQVLLLPRLEAQKEDYLDTLKYVTGCRDAYLKLL